MTHLKNRVRLFKLDYFKNSIYVVIMEKLELR